jgi:carbamoyltransferase
MTAPAPDLRWLCDALRAAGYTAEALKRTLGITYPDDVGALNHAPALERLADDSSPAATCIRLFFLEGAVPSRTIGAVLSRQQRALLAGAGLVRMRGTQVEAQLRLDPVGEQYFASDRRFRPPARRAAHLPGTDSLILRAAVALPRLPRILDLCTGSGIQALPHAHLADHIVGVDINPRAAAVAQLNAALNGVSRFEARVGDLYAPVRSAAFDVIIANPPFVTSPYRKGPAYHAGGPTGDAVLRRIIAGWPRHLRDGGRAFAISHVGLRSGADVDAVAAGWFETFPGRALVLVLENGTAVDLAAAQSLFALARGLRAYAAEVHRWVSYLRRQRISSIAAVLIAAERGPTPRLEVVDATPRVLPIPLGAPPDQRVRTWFGDTA